VVARHFASAQDFEMVTICGMGQREAIAQYLVSGGIMVPVIVLSGTAAMLGRATVPVALTVLWIGFATLVIAKWPLSRKEFWVSFGPSRLSPPRRKLYWAAYCMLAFGLLLALFGLVSARIPA
jgi:hypothetical protein